MASALKMPGNEAIQEGFLTGTEQTSNKMTDSTCSLTDITLEQAALKLQEIEKENMALKDNLRTHNAIIKKQYDTLAEWRKKENEKFEQTKALIIALKSENQELQVKVMALTDKEKELMQQNQSFEEEKARLLRQKAMSDQRLYNVYRMAEEQGVNGLALEELNDAQDLPDAPILASTAEKEVIIAKLEAALTSKEEMVDQLRAEILQKDEEMKKYKDTTKHLLKDMESQQKLKQGIEEENRMLTKQILLAEQKLHKQMQAVMATTRREMQAEQMFSTSTFGSAMEVVGPASSVAAEQRLENLLDGEPGNFSYHENVEDLVGIAKSLEAKEKEELSTDRLLKTLNEEKREKQQLKDRIKKLEKELQDMNIKQGEASKELEEVHKKAAETAETLAQDYEKKLMDMTKNSNSKPIQASDTEDITTLRAQVLALLREVDETQNKLSAAMAALHHKEGRNLELEQINQSLRKEYNDHWQETQVLVQNLRAQLSQQHKSQQEFHYIKIQHEQLQFSFSALVTDYKELQETFEAYRLQMERQAPERQAPRVRKDTMEEINRLTAQVIAADEAIAQRDDQLEKLRNEMAQSSQLDEKIQLLQFQADLYRSDFTAERDARSKLAEEKNKLEEENRRLLRELHALQQQNRIITEELDGHNQRQISDMQRRFQTGSMNYDIPPVLRATPPLAQDYRLQMQDNRPQVNDYRHHLHDYREPASPAHQVQAVNATHLAPGHRDEEEPLSFQDLECPSCSSHFPDIDTLQLHVPDCIDSKR